MNSISNSEFDQELSLENIESPANLQEMRRNRSTIIKLPMLASSILTGEKRKVKHCRIKSRSLEVSFCELNLTKPKKRIQQDSVIREKDHNKLKFHKITGLVKIKKPKKHLIENKIDNLRKALDRDLKKHTKLSIIDSLESKVKERIYSSIKILQKSRNQNTIASFSIIHAVLENDIRLIEAHIDECLNDYQRVILVNTRDQYSRTCLHYAASLGQVETIEMMMVTGADPRIKDAYGRTSLHYAAFQDNKDIIELLKRAFYKASKISERANENTNYHTIARLLKHKKLKKMAKLPKPQANLLNAFPTEAKLLDYSMLCLEIQRHMDRMGISETKSQLKRAEILNLEEYFNNKDDIGRTALHIAALCDKISIIRILLDNGANPDIKDINGSRPLELSSSKLASSILIGRMKSSKRMITQKSIKISENKTSGILTKDLLSIDDHKLLSFHTGTSQENYLHIAIKSKNLDAVTILLQKNLSPVIQNKFG